MIKSLADRIQLWRFGPVAPEQRELDSRASDLRTIKTLLWVLVIVLVVVPVAAGLVLLAAAN